MSDDGFVDVALRCSSVRARVVERQARRHRRRRRRRRRHRRRRVKDKRRRARARARARARSRPLMIGAGQFFRLSSIAANCEIFSS